MAAVTRQLPLGELVPGSPGRAGTGDLDRLWEQPRAWFRLERLELFLALRCLCHRLRPAAAALLVWGEHTPLRDF